MTGGDLRLSQFTVLGPGPAADTVTVVSTFTRTSCVIPVWIIPSVREGKAVPPEYVAALKEMGVLVSREQEAEQQRLVAEDGDQEQTSTKELTVVVPMTSKCNLACSYCYQVTHGEFRGPEAPDMVDWSEDAVRRLAAFVDGLIATRRYDRLKVRWYGGEPLLRPKTLLEVSRVLGEVTGGREIAFRSMIVTNGVLLSQANIAVLQEARVDRLEISLDGPPEHHNSLRPSLGGLETYDDVLEGILAAVDAFPCVVLRVNIHARNVASIVDWLRTLSATPQIRKVFFKFKLVEGDSTNSLSWQEFAQACARYTSELKVLGLQFLQPRLATETCPAIRNNYYIVQSDLRVYKCPQNLGSTHHVGAIGADGAMSPTPALALWEGYRASKNSDCAACAHLPHCHGGCPYNEIMTTQSKRSLQVYRREERCCRERVSPELLVARLA